MSIDFNTLFFRVFNTAFGQDADIVCHYAEGDQARVAYAVKQVQPERLDALLKEVSLFKENYANILHKNILILDDEEVIEVGYLSDKQMTVSDVLALIVTETEKQIALLKTC